MSGREPDRDLRALFRVLREAEQSRAPAFSDLASRNRPPTRRGWWLLAPAGAIAAGLALWLASAPEPSRQVSLGRTPWWFTPSDVLLDTPQGELLHTVPTLRELRTSFELRAPPRRRRP